MDTQRRIELREVSEHFRIDIEVSLAVKIDFADRSAKGLASAEARGLRSRPLHRKAYLMRRMGLRGVLRGKRSPITTDAGAKDERPLDLVNREFVTIRPNQRWVGCSDRSETFLPSRLSRRIRSCGSFSRGGSHRPYRFLNVSLVIGTMAEYEIDILKLQTTQSGFRAFQDVLSG